MKKILLFLFLVIISASLYAQKEDYIWLTGYSSNTIDSTFGGTQIDFNTEPPTVSYVFLGIEHFYLSDASISDREGNLLFYSDGIKVASNNHQILENGDNLGPNEFHQSWYDIGLPLPQGTMILPYPGQADSLYFLFYSEMSNEQIGDSQFSVPNFLYSTIKTGTENNSITVQEKNVVIISDSLSYGKISGTRHANGRDWWILIGEVLTNNYYTILITNNGIEEIFKQSIGSIPIFGTAYQSIFSSNGTKYARAGTFYFSEPGQIDIYDFDRCTGLLSNPLHIPIDTTEEGFVDGAFGGLAFSPDSELLYHSNYWKIVQYDMLASDIRASADTIVNYDGFQDPITGVPTNYGLAQLAPNGKIYVATTGNTRYMHIIHNPNERGTACDVEQHGLQLATFNDWSVPNHPNYRLKALIGSPCDTIRPLAAFTYDSLSNIVFTDQSVRTPTEWQWTFGDGNSSTEQNPNHTYTENGTYEVCLIVSNEAGSDTTCQQVMVVVTSTQDLANAKFKVFPNPTRGRVTVSLPNDKSRPWRLMNVLGQEMERGFFSTVEATLDLRRLGSGVYWLEVEGLGSKKILLNTE